MTLQKLYTGSSAAFAAATFLLISFANPQLSSVRRCLLQQADNGSVSALSERPNLVLYSAYKGFLWPVSLVNSVVLHDMPFTTWLLSRYDPFPDACR